MLITDKALTILSTIWLIFYITTLTLLIYTLWFKYEEEGTKADISRTTYLGAFWILVANSIITLLLLFNYFSKIKGFEEIEGIAVLVFSSCPSILLFFSLFIYFIFISIYEKSNIVAATIISLINLIFSVPILDIFHSLNI